MVGKKGDSVRRVLAVLLVVAIFLSVLGSYVSMVVYRDYRDGFGTVTRIEGNSGPRTATVGVLVVVPEEVGREGGFAGG